MNREIRSYDYVNHPYAAVRDALVKDPAGVLRAATNAAASRASAVAAALHVNIGPLDIGAEIAVTVGEISEQSYTMRRFHGSRASRSNGRPRSAQRCFPS